MLGQTIDLNQIAMFGSSVAINDIGDIVSIGAPAMIAGSGNGQIFSYKYDDSNWNQIGLPIDDINSSGGNIGLEKSLAINSSGDKLIYGNNGRSEVLDLFVFSLDSCASYGCLDPLALNFDPSATITDNSCLFTIMGCINPLASNYDSTATNDDGSCYFLGCIDTLACNYDSTADTTDGSCC